ncbi:MAG TPA: UDP-N-acetylmuramoyl-tripeptide--D-alanyl-D-alanine ligase [Jatrophihabitans sp.]|jgi:UDP-N-acetylmuramoyl-tripeptide--D-alanyl-D-alanine ligase
MIALTLAEIAEIAGGTLHIDPLHIDPLHIDPRHIDPQHEADPLTVVHGPVEYDSRKVAPGALFAAFVGEQVDGHDFVPAALAAGAVASLVSRPVAGPHILVDDVLTGVTALATAVSPRLTATIIGVTGSSGKTSTKDLVAHVLSTAGRTVAPAGSLNNELGFPSTVLRADEQTDFLVLELGARGVGHISHLTAIARPSIGVVLNVGSAHLGEFGSRDAIARAKGELVEALPQGGVAVLNADDRLVCAMEGRTSARVVTFGESRAADVRAENVALDDYGRARFTLAAGAETAPVTLHLVGEHHVSNALAAAAVGLECGLGLTQIAAALSSATAESRWRMEVTERVDGVTVINDAYNANPESMRAALKTLATVQRARRAAVDGTVQRARRADDDAGLARGGRGGARSFAVLGPMAELGDTTPIEHMDLGRFAVRLDISRVIAVGEAARPIQHGATLEGSWDGESSWVPDVDAAVAMLRAELRPGDVVLVKASRAASLERVALAIVEDGAVTDSTAGEDSGA